MDKSTINPALAREIHEEMRARNGDKRKKLEDAGTEWRREANIIAVQIFNDRKKRGLSVDEAAVCVDDLNGFPVPEGVDPSIRGTVFMNTKVWKRHGFALGNREGRSDKRVMNTYILRDP